MATRNNILILAMFGILIALFIGGIVAGQITSPIKVLTEGVLKIGSGDLSTRVVVKTQTEIGRLAGTFNQMAQDLEKSTQQLVQKEKMARELELAGEIQRELLPSVLPKIKNLDIAASLVSAEEVGGDCYDFLPIDEDNMIFYIGDVTGHGVPAGLVSAINNALVPAFMYHYRTTQELIIHLNELLKTKMRPNVFMTMVMAHWHADISKLGYTQAGHDPILHYDAATGKIRELSTGGMALGMIPDLSKIVKTDYVDMNLGDVAVMYTDGIPEAWANEKESYGMDRLKESIVRHSTKATAQEIHDGIIADVRAYMGTYPQADDITLIVVKRNA
jgi:phosphoserine phosphatase RsbU/P